MELLWGSLKETLVRLPWRTDYRDVVSHPESLGMGWGWSDANAAGQKSGFSKVSLFFYAMILRTKRENYMYSETRGK